MTKSQAYINANQQKFLDELFELLRIPSVSTDSTKVDEIHKAANFLIQQLTSLHLDRVELFETPGHPIVYGEHCPHPDKPIVLIYGHYDVQPSDPDHLWDTPAFEPTIKDGNIYARGASDDKGQAFTHVKALESFIKSGEEIPVNVKIILEGEEEIGSPNLVPFIEAHKEMLRTDMVLISDTSMFGKDQPSITYGLRGLAYLEVEVVGPNRDLHSGVYGGAVENPLNVLCEMIAKMKDEHGVIQIPGFYDNVIELTGADRAASAALPFDEEAYKQSLDIDAVHGERGYTTLERASARPTLDVNGIWGGYTGEGAKTVLPSKANAKISMRLVPNQDPKEIAKLFTDYFNSIAPDTVKVSVTEHHGGYASITNLDFYGLKAAAKAFEDVFQKEVLFAREGGSIPIVADFKRVLGVESILMGFGLTSDAIHSPNEKFSIHDFHRGIKTSARFLELLPDFVGQS
jgi:acetylornithine deacetylase/succinyl-diaminopimelate desuccinylase-like protein